MLSRSKSDPLDKIKALLASAAGTEPSIRGIYLDETLREFFYLNATVKIPAIAVSSIDHEQSLEVLNKISASLSPFLAGHEYLEEKNPGYEEHSIHLGSLFRGRILDFIHMLRLDFKFSSHSGTIIRPGDTATYPSYETEMIYFKSSLVPVRKGGSPSAFQSIRLNESVTVAAEDSSKRLYTSVLFDDFSNREISIDLSRRTGCSFSIPVTIFPMIMYEYFTACLSIPDPVPSRIEKALSVFEPLFIFLYSIMVGNATELPPEGLEEFLKVKGDKILMSPALMKDLNDYFSSYSTSADDELMLKGWKKINCR